MLFPYTYVPHKMEKMQRFINFIFYQVWCRARKAGPYGLNLFDANPPLKKVMTSFAYDHSDAGDRFASQVQAIYLSFTQLKHRDIAQFKRWYQGNNNLAKVCANDPTAHLARYADIAVNYKDIADQLSTFFRGLYSQSLLKLSALSAEIGDIDDHYKTFMQKNEAGKCPFCGIGDIKGEHHSKREAYDHYLPKSLYPFNSINFRNLAPACHECNSTYKLRKDPAHNQAGRRKAFYPFSAAAPAIDIQVTLLHSDVENLKPADVQMQFGPAAVTEELETWKDVYGIEERYIAKVCGENDGKYWLTQVVEEGKAYGKQPIDILNMRAQQAQNRPYADCNFLRKPFLDACLQIGVL